MRRNCFFILADGSFIGLYIIRVTDGDTIYGCVWEGTEFSIENNNLKEEYKLECKNNIEGISLSCRLTHLLFASLSLGLI